MPFKWNAVFLACCLGVSALLASPAAEAARKYNPGHYVALLRSQDSPAYMAASLKPGVKGLMKRYSWKSLEPTPGAYNFSEIQSDLHWAAAYGVRLVVMIEDKTFVAERATPAYLDSYTRRNRKGGYTLLRWNPYVVDRTQRLFRALGRFDGHWAFEGIATQESALGLDESVLTQNGYTPEKYRDAYLAIFNTAGSALPTSRIFWFMNYFPRKQEYIAHIAGAMASKGLVMGGPDVLPDDRVLQDMAYPFYDQFRSKMPLFGQVEGECYAHLHKTCCYPNKYWTAPELFRFARDRLHVDYMFWVRVPKPTPSDAQDWFDALPVIENNPLFNQ